MKDFIENTKVLFVDDEPELLNAFTSLMRKEKLQIRTLQSSGSIAEVLETEGPFALVLSDQRMPEYDGVQVLEIVKGKFPETIRVLITGYSDYNDTIRAINLGGINSYFSKPWDDEDVKRKIKQFVTQYNLKQHNKHLLNLLDEENRNLSELLEGTVAKTVQILGDFANQVSPQVADLGSRVKTVGIAFLKNLTHLSLQEKWEIMRAFDLFNFGYALLPTHSRTSIIKEGISIIENSPVLFNHHLLAAGLIKSIPRFEGVARIIELQRKDYNGNGEPANVQISGEDIPLGARLLHILIDLVKSTSGLSGTEQLRRMSRLPLKYDVKLIDQILGKSIETSFTTEERYLTVSKLTPGMIPKDEIRSKSGQLLMKADTALTETIVNILNQWHIKDPIAEPVRVICISKK